MRAATPQKQAGASTPFCVAHRVRCVRMDFVASINDKKVSTCHE